MIYKTLAPKILELYSTLHSITKVADNLCCGYTTVQKVLKMNNIPILSSYVVPPKETLTTRNENRYELKLLGKKRCLKCREIHDISFFNIKNKNRLEAICKNCSKERSKKFKDKIRKDPELYCKAIIAHIKSRAKNIRVPFDTNAEDLFHILKKQKYKCFYTGSILDFTITVKEKNRPHILFPSVDRLDPDKGYVTSNLVWSVYYINRMKSDLSYIDFIKTMKDILVYRNE